jgi:hypothetical protein
MTRAKIHIKKEADGTWHTEINGAPYYAATRETLIHGLNQHFLTDVLTDLVVLDEIEGV